jgi:hypothetical protein
MLPDLLAEVRYAPAVSRDTHPPEVALGVSVDQDGSVDLPKTQYAETTDGVSIAYQVLL